MTETATETPNPWEGFKGGVWTESINVRDFIQQNYTPYEGDGSFLAGPTSRTNDLWDEVKDLMKKEIDAGGLLDADTEVVSTIVSHAPGYIDKDKEQVVGLQTDAPLKRALMPFGGLRMAQKALESYGLQMCPTPLSSSVVFARLTMRVCSMPTPAISALPAPPASSPGCPMPTAAGESSATTAA